MRQYFNDGFELDISDPSVLGEVSVLDDIMCEMRCGDDVGYGIIELVIRGKYPKYGFQGY